ncbi:MAG TPA: small ribosomal subunit Rsm22 family protein [Polyangia bacterium]
MTRESRGSRPPARVDGRDQAVARVHQGLVGERALIGTPYLGDARLRRAYDDTIAPRTGAALAKILAEVAPAPATRAARRLRLLDLGAGTGAASEAFRAHFGQVDVVAVDQVPAPGVLTADLERFDIPPRLEGRFDFIVAAHVLNELHAREPLATRIAARARKAQVWCNRLLDDGGTLILLEPALRETSRELLAVRDQLVAAGLVVVAPCLWIGPCPALGRERDWCHDTAVRADAKGPAARVDFSYLAVRTQGEPVTDPTLFRIVSAPLAEKGRLRIFGCGPAGRQPLVRLTRHESDSNAAFADLERGDLARVARTTFARDGLRITEETVVSRPR